MARARNIKPGFFANEDLAECDPLARLLFAGLWCLSDREGRLEDRPKRIRAELLPYDMCDADDLLNQLQTHGFIHRYSHGEGRFIQVLKFNSHQNPHMKEAKSSIPAMNSPIQEQVLPDAAPDKHRACTVQDQVKHQEHPAESGFLIPDSLIPDSKGDTAPRKRSTTAPTAARPDEVSEPVWQDFQRLRREKRAPLTDTALAGVRREAEKAGVPLEAAIAYCCEAGWQTFNAGWYADRTKGKSTINGGSGREAPHKFAGASAAIYEGVFE